MPLTEWVRRGNDCEPTFRGPKQLRVCKRSGTLRTKLRHLSCSSCCSELQGVQLQGSMATGNVRALNAQKK